MEAGPAVLEVGCGAGFSARYLQAVYSSYVGIDYSRGLIDYAKQHHSSPKTAFYAVNVNDYHPDQNFDIIFMIGVLHHFDQVEKTLEHITGMLRPGGWIVANEPQSSNLAIQVARRIRVRVDLSYSGEQQQFSPRELRRIYEQAGLKNIIIAPQGIFSTALAEVVLMPESIFTFLSRLAVLLDNLLESRFSSLLLPFSWNVIVAGQLLGRS